MEATPDKIAVEIDLASLWVDHEDGMTFQAFVADMAAERLLRDRSSIEEFRRRVVSIGDEEIREALKPIVAQALDETIQQTDAFGTPRGQKQSLREIIVRKAVEELQKPRERQGGRYGQMETLIQQLIRTEVETALANDLRAEIHGAREKVLAAVAEQAGEIIAETVAKLAEGRRL